MGDVSEMMLDGTLCEGCGVYMDGEADGYPVRCASCQGDSPGPGFVEKKFTWAKCPVCRRTVKAVGLSQHMSAKHP